MIKFILSLSVLLFLSLPSHAAEIAGVHFDDTYQNQNITLSLQGTGLKTVMFFKAFVAAYYLGGKTQVDEIGQTAKRIEVQYFVNIPGKKLNSYTVERMKDNVTAAEMEGLKNQLGQMAIYFTDLKPGDRFALTYVPSLGTSFEYNGKKTGIIEGSTFAKALFSVWIGEKPFDELLKQAIVGSPKTTIASTLPRDITPGYSSRIITIGPKETAMNGSIKYSVIGRYSAQFNDFKGSIAVDEESDTIQSVWLDINPASIHSNCAWCDRIVCSKQLLDTAKYPDIVFKSKDIVLVNGNYQVNGTIELHGITKDVQLPFQYTIKKDPTTGVKTLEVSGKWDINRKDFKVIWNALLDHGGILVGDYITVQWAIKVNL